MPRLTADTVLQRAIAPAADDRLALADAYGKRAPQYAQALRDRESVLALKGKKLAAMGKDELKVAFNALVWAQQWSESLADSNPGNATERRCRRDAALFRRLRLVCFGKTVLEAELETAATVVVWPPSPEAKALLGSCAPSASSPDADPAPTLGADAVSISPECSTMAQHPTGAAQHRRRAQTSDGYTFYENQDGT